MNVLQTELPGVLLIEPKVFADARGFFMESYNARRYAEQGIGSTFVQDNHSRSVAGTIRGLHYQLLPGQQKLVRAVVGTIVDVVVDIRRGSPTYGRWEAFELSAENRRQLFVPVGCAHGFCVTSPIAEVEYKVDTYYAPDLERGIRYDDPAIGVEWPDVTPILSDKDKVLPTLAEAEHDFIWEA